MLFHLGANFLVRFRWKEVGDEIRVLAQHAEKEVLRLNCLASILGCRLPGEKDAAACFLRVVFKHRCLELYRTFPRSRALGGTRTRMAPIVADGP